MSRGLVVVGVLGAIAVGACSGSSTAHASNRGTIAGNLQLASQLPGRPPQGVSGTITMREAGHPTLTVTVSSGGKFSAEVPAGSYTVTGQSPMFMVNGSEGICDVQSNNGPVPVRVTVGQTTSVTVECPTK